MFLQPNFSIVNLASTYLISVTVATISLLPTVGLAQTFPSPCNLLILKLDLSAEQREQAEIICNQTQGRIRTESITALRTILDDTQLATFDQKVREVERLYNYPDNNGCGGRERSDQRLSPKFFLSSCR